MALKSFLEYIICTACSKRYEVGDILRLCTNCGKVLFAKYDLEKARETLILAKLDQRRYDIWRMHEIMPVYNERFRFTLGEGWTPLLNLDRIGSTLNLKHLMLKDEGQNPTGTFKSRGLCAAVSKAVELGVKEFVIPTAGNAGAALSAYTSRSGTTSHVYMPKISSQLIQKEIQAMGGNLTLVDGLISDAGKIAQRYAEKNNWFDVSTLKEPYRVEGKKTMGLEIAEQFNFLLPDAIIYPTGGGTGIVGMMKAWDELEEIGLLDDKRPRMISVQVDTCAPIVKAYREGQKSAEFWENASTFASGLRVPAAIADYLILDAIYKTKGTAVSVSDEDIRKMMFYTAKTEGIMLAPEAAATISAVRQLQDEQQYFDTDEKIVLLGTGSGLTTPDEW